jgi:hypothetical protein
MNRDNAERMTDQMMEQIRATFKSIPPLVQVSLREKIRAVVRNWTGV